MISPNSGQAIGLQLNADLYLVRFCLVRCPCLKGLDLRQNAEEILYVMPDLMGNHIGLREPAGLAPDLTTVKTRLDLPEKACIEIDPLIVRAIKWSHRGLRHSTG